MHAHGRFAQSERLADLAGALVGDVTHREHRALTIRELLDRGGAYAQMWMLQQQEEAEREKAAATASPVTP